MKYFLGSYNDLVGAFNPSEKNDFVNWDDYSPNTNGKIKLMFQTTNQ